MHSIFFFILSGSSDILTLKRFVSGISYSILPFFLPIDYSEQGHRNLAQEFDFMVPVLVIDSHLQNTVDVAHIAGEDTREMSE